jgi:hypothetical protein
MPAMPGYSIVQTCAQGTGQPGHGAQMLYSLAVSTKAFAVSITKVVSFGRKGEHNV